MVMVNLYLYFMMIFYFCFQWDGTGCEGWYWEEDYVIHVTKATKADEAVSQLKKSVDAM